MYVVIALVDAQSARTRPSRVMSTPVEGCCSSRLRLSPSSSVASAGMNVPKRSIRSPIVSGEATREKSPTVSRRIEGIAKNEL